MRHIDRLPKPQILQEKEELWKAQFLEAYHNGSKKRPDSTKYGNPKVLDALKRMSFSKCFYCESLLKGIPQEIDHFIEVSDYPELSFEWSNLYLSCSNCNNKLPQSSIPVDQVLDPCRNSDTEIQENISFQEELIIAVPGSPKGLETIQKYRLDTEQLDYRRSKWLNRIYNEVTNIQKNMIAENRKATTPEEKKLLLQFMQPNQPYSLMSEIFIKKNFPQLFA